MSSFIVDNDHIRAVVTWASLNGFFRQISHFADLLTEADRETALGQIFINDNIKSVNARYDACDEPEIYRHRHLAQALNLTPVQIIKLIDCLTYQSSDYKDWRQSFAHELRTIIRDMAISKLPGYRDAMWEYKAKEPQHTLLRAI